MVVFIPILSSLIWSYEQEDYIDDPGNLSYHMT